VAAHRISTSGGNKCRARSLRRKLPSDSRRAERSASAAQFASDLASFEGVGGIPVLNIDPVRSLFRQFAVFTMLLELDAISVGPARLF